MVGALDACCSKRLSPGGAGNPKSPFHDDLSQPVFAVGLSVSHFATHSPTSRVSWWLMALWPAEAILRATYHGNKMTCS